MNSLEQQRKWYCLLPTAGLVGLPSSALLSSTALVPLAAAEQLINRVGPLHQTIAIEYAWHIGEAWLCTAAIVAQC